MVDVMTPLVSVKQLGEASISSFALSSIFEWDWDDISGDEVTLR